MTKDNLYIFDTTLRDGNQTPGVDFTLDDKNRISNILDELGVDYIEGGYSCEQTQLIQIFLTRYQTLKNQNLYHLE